VRLILCALLFALPLAASAGEGRLERILERGRLIVGVKTDYPPWGMVAPDGAIVGLEPDLARDLADRLGVGLELVPVTGANRLQRLAQGQVDLVIATMGDTAERRSMADLILPHYYASGVSLLARADARFHDWEELAGRPVCLAEGAFFNRTLAERYRIDPIVFPGIRDALMALADGRCTGFAFDDTVLARILAEPGRAGYRLAMPTILATPWAVAVARGEGAAAWGRFVAGRVADWHRSGLLVELQARWGLPPSDFLAAGHARWSSPACAAPGASCAAPASGASPGVPASRLAPFLDPFDRARLLRGAWLTLALSLTAIAGSLAIGAALAWARSAARPGGLAGLAVLPFWGLVGLSRMTPPLLQLYIVFFGLGGLLSRSLGSTLSSFAVAALVLSLYAGATDAALIRAELVRLAGERPGIPPHRLLPAAFERAYEGLAAASVNIVKAAGLASTIALPEVVASVGSVLADGGDAATLMNVLVIYYFLFVLAVLGLLRAGRSLVARLT
jgi:polar amino acid transport system substrate-binding protein